MSDSGELQELQEFYAKLKQYKESVNHRQGRSDDTLREQLVRESGRIRPIVIKAMGSAPSLVLSRLGRVDAFREGLKPYDPFMGAPESLDTLLDAVNQSMGILESPPIQHTPNSEFKKGAEAVIPVSVFIAHGGSSEALSKVRDFLLALRCRPIVAEIEPSQGRSVNEQVEWCLSQSDCAIVLNEAESPDEGKLYARPNVQIEAGRFQERFPDKVIYLSEERAKFPTIISEKVWERFAQDNMERAFLKIVRELAAFGFLKAEKRA